MKEIVKLAITLMVICAIAAFALAYTNQITSAIIEKRELEAKIAQMKELFPDVTDLQEKTVDGQTATLGLNGEGKVVGVMTEGRTEGYGGTIRFALAVNAEGKIAALTILDQNETPGLGAKIKDSQFRDQFKGKSAGDAFALGQDLDAISGATVSSRAMATGVKSSLQDISLRFLGAQ